MTPQDRAETTLTLPGNTPVALPRIAMLIQGAPGLTQCSVDDVTLSSLTLRDEAMTILLGLRFVNETTKLTVTLQLLEPGRDPQVLLERVTALLQRELGAQVVSEAAEPLRLARRATARPRPMLTMAGPAPRPAARLAPVVPRRIQGVAANCERPPRVVPLVAPKPRLVGQTVKRRDPQTAHILAYEASIRSALLREATESELAELQGPNPRPSTPVRLTTWAVSISVATMSLPLALPIMAHNLVRGEDMRVASLAAGVGGLFVALDSSGAMAALPGF